ncbi:MAG: hypothetical protein ABWY82_27200 [Tardiphaga sp.]
MQQMPEYRNRFRAFAFVALLVAFTAPAFAAEKCPVSDAAAEKAGGLANAVTAAIDTAWSCSGAYQILEACALGSSGDNALSTIVQSKCEPMFLPKATPAIKSDYKKARAKCDQIAVKNQGSMYQSQAAVCIARSARDFARKYALKG